MQISLKAVVFACALAFSATSYGFDCCAFLGIGAPPCGCGNGNCCDNCEPDRWIPTGCGCEASCGCEADCGCEASCGCTGSCEPSCGCSGGYCVDGRKYAGQKYTCGCKSYFPIAVCTGPVDCCEPSCGCGDSCCEASCGCEPSCGCGCGDCCEPSCGCECECQPDCCSSLFRICGRVCDAVCGGGSCGCSGEVYWSEWHNDPPRCCDPCNRCGQWIGPSAGGCGSGGCGCNGGGYGGPVNDSYGDGGYYSSRRPTRPHGGTTLAAGNRPKRPSTNAAVARGNKNPYTNARTSRKPQPAARQPSHR